MVTLARRISKIAVLGAKEPFTTFFVDRVVPIPVLAFIPKVTSDFYLKQDIVGPTLLPTDSQQVNSLDMDKSFLAYLEASTFFRGSDHLFLLLAGTNKRKTASSWEITSSLVKIISMAFSFKGVAMTDGVTAYSICNMTAFWAAVSGLS